MVDVTRLKNQVTCNYSGNYENMQKIAIQRGHVGAFHLPNMLIHLKSEEYDSIKVHSDIKKILSILLDKNHL